MFHSLWCVSCERVHGVPGDVCVDQDKLSDPEEDLGHAGLQLGAAQRVHAQVQEVQVGGVGDDGADLATGVNEKHKRRLNMYKNFDFN